MIGVRPLVLAAFFFACVFALALAPRAARADATIDAAEVENGYPRDLTFTLSATAPVDIVDVTLRYTILGSNVGAIGKPEPANFTAGTNVSTSVKVDTNPNTNWVPVGNRIEWYWEIALADGTTTVGPTSTYLYLPPDKEWKTAEDDLSTVYYTGPRDGLAAELLEAMQETHQSHGVELLQTQLEPEDHVTVIIMGTAEEIREAQPSKGDTLDESTAVVTCGFRPGNSKHLIFGTVACGGSDPVDTIRHEFAHILNAAAGEGTLVSLPTWLEEGLAVVAQEDPGEYVATFEAALRRDALLPFTEMILPVADERQVILQYGQAFAMTTYILNEYGQPKLNQLLDLTRRNTRFDVAFEQVYGLTMETFEEEFLAAVGSGGVPTPQPTQQERPSQPTPQATAEERPDEPEAEEPDRDEAAIGGDDDDDSFDQVMIALVGVAVLLMLAGVMSFLLLMFMQNQRGGRA
jgi:hypothetical protein